MQWLGCVERWSKGLAQGPHRVKTFQPSTQIFNCLSSHRPTIQCLKCGYLTNPIRAVELSSSTLALLIASLITGFLWNLPLSRVVVVTIFNNGINGVPWNVQGLGNIFSKQTLDDMFPELFRLSRTLYQTTKAQIYSCQPTASSQSLKSCPNPALLMACTCVPSRYSVKITQTFWNLPVVWSETYPAVWSVCFAMDSSVRLPHIRRMQE